MVTPKDSIVFQAGEDDKAQGTAGADVHLVEAKDHFSEIGTFPISRRLAFQGPNIDPYLRYALQVDVANVMKELEELLGLESSEAGVSQSVSRSQPALPEDVESFDAEGKVLFFFWLLYDCGFVMFFGVCRFHEESGSLRDLESWSNHGVAMREGLCRVVLSCP